MADQQNDMISWIAIPDAQTLAHEDVMRFDHEGATYAIYRDKKGAYSASDGLCTHEQAHLCDGFVIGDAIECPLHQGRFHIRSGKALGAPVCIDLNIYPVRAENGQVLIGLTV